MITYRLARLAACMVFVVPLSSASCAARGAEPMILLSFHEGFDLGQVVPQDAVPSLVRGDATTLLQVRTGHAARWPGITLKAPPELWDLSAFNHIALHIANAGSDPVAVHCRVDCPGGDGAKNSSTERVEIAPRERLKLTVPLRRKLPAALAEKLFGMRGYPGGYGKDD